MNRFFCFCAFNGCVGQLLTHSHTAQTTFKRYLYNTAHVEQHDLSLSALENGFQTLSMGE